MHNSANTICKQAACWVVDHYISDENPSAGMTKINDFDWPEGFGEYRDFSLSNVQIWGARQFTYGVVWQHRAIHC